MGNIAHITCCLNTAYAVELPMQYTAHITNIGILKMLLRCHCSIMHALHTVETLYMVLRCQ